MKQLDFIVLGFMVVFVILIIAAETKSQDYGVQFQTHTIREIYSPTFPSGATTDGINTSTYTTGESVTNFGGVYFLGERKSCAKIGNGFICN